jgi:uncharacterized protein YegP (UPF0339 family)
MPSKFVLTKCISGRYRFVLRDASGVIILSSERHASRGNALNAIDSVKTNAPIEGRYDRRSENGRHYFTLLARNSQLLGTSEHYISAEACDAAMGAVRASAAAAVVELLD